MDFLNSYLALGEAFYQKSLPTLVPAPELFLFNQALAKQLPIAESLLSDNDALAQVFSGNQIFPSSEPIALAYSGHQFGHFNPQLGDGRAHLLGDVIDRRGLKWDVQLKGSGRSAFSRNGDGRCAIGPAVREFIMSEAMQALGVPTSQCLAVVTTGDTVLRQRGHPGAVVTRIASSHIRVGTFQYFAARGDIDSLKALAEYTIQRHYPHITAEGPDRWIALLDGVMDKQIELVVQWMRVGFIHGVMNTDNTAISGETIDFGPCAMMGVYDPNTVYSSIDHQGRYAFGKQPNIAHWNVTRFAECLVQLIDQDDKSVMRKLSDVINAFAARFQAAYLAMMAGKFGIKALEKGDSDLINTLLESLVEEKLDYTLSFNILAQALSCESAKNEMQSSLGEVFEQWKARVLNQGLSVENIQASMRQFNPLVIPRNHHVEAVLKSCEETGLPDAALALLDVLRQPYTQLKKTVDYQGLDADSDQRHQTFCGT